MRIDIRSYEAECEKVRKKSIVGGHDGGCEGYEFEWAWGLRECTQAALRAVNHHCCDPNIQIT